jgi:membrane protease YdiL (CAAX protease family)
VSGTDQSNPPAALGVEIAVALCGLWLLWKYVLSPSAPAAERLLAEWRIPPIDFGCYAFFTIAGYLALSALVGLVLKHVMLSDDAAKVIGAVIQDVGFLLGMYGFHLFYRKVNRTAPKPPSPLGPAIRSGAVTFFIAMAIVDVTMLAWSYVISVLGLPDKNQEFVDIAQNSASPWMNASLIATAALLVPVTEELVFRAGLFRYFKTRIPRWLAIVLTSALFGALHASWGGGTVVGLPSVVPLMVLAVVFCLAYERTGRIGTVIVAHSLFNLYTFVLIAAGMHT